MQCNETFREKIKIYSRKKFDAFFVHITGERRVWCGGKNKFIEKKNRPKCKSGGAELTPKKNLVRFEASGRENIRQLIPSKGGWRKKAGKFHLFYSIFSSNFPRHHRIVIIVICYVHCVHVCLFVSRESKANAK